MTHKEPDNRQRAIDEAVAVVDDILSGKKDIELGAKEIFWTALDSYDFASETKKYVYDSIGLEKAYGLLDACIDLRDADYPWQKGKTNEQLHDEARDELLKALKKWRGNTETTETIYIHAEYDDRAKEYIPYEYNSSLGELTDGYEYEDVEKGKYQVWEYPSGKIFQVKPDRDVDDKQLYSTPHSAKGIVWLPKLEELEENKQKVNDAVKDLQ